MRSLTLLLWLLAGPALSAPIYYTFTTVEHLQSQDENISYVYTNPLSYVFAVDFDAEAYGKYNIGTSSPRQDGLADFGYKKTTLDYFYIDLLTPQLISFKERPSTPLYFEELHIGRTTTSVDTNPNDSYYGVDGSVRFEFGYLQDYVDVEQYSEWYEFIVQGVPYQYQTYGLSVGDMFSISDYGFSADGARTKVRFWAELTEISDVNPLEPISVPAVGTLPLAAISIASLLALRRSQRPSCRPVLSRTKFLPQQSSQTDRSDVRISKFHLHKVLGVF